MFQTPVLGQGSGLLTTRDQRHSVVNRLVVIIVVVSSRLLIVWRLVSATKLLLEPELLELFKVLRGVVVADQLTITGNRLTVLDDNLSDHKPSQQSVRKVSRWIQATYDVTRHELSGENDLFFTIAHNCRLHRDVTF